MSLSISMNERLDYTADNEDLLYQGMKTDKSMGILKGNYIDMLRKVFSMPKNEVHNSADELDIFPSRKQVSGEAKVVGATEIHVLEILSKISERYEHTLFSYPAIITDIEKNESGEPVKVIVSTSVNGKDIIIRRPIKNFKFEVRPGMKIIVDGKKRGSSKTLSFRTAQPLQLDTSQMHLLERIVSKFNSGPNV